jgi:hypothetical protein
MNSEHTRTLWLSPANQNAAIETFLRSMSAIDDKDEVVELKMTPTKEGTVQIDLKLKKETDTSN